MSFMVVETWSAAYRHGERWLGCPCGLGKCHVVGDAKLYSVYIGVAQIWNLLMWRSYYCCVLGRWRWGHCRIIPRTDRWSSARACVR